MGKTKQTPDPLVQEMFTSWYKMGHRQVYRINPTLTPLATVEDAMKILQEHFEERAKAYQKELHVEIPEGVQ